ncbi:hypothetical protein JNJ66_03980 [Candidatus Saccharibacteria bacterium]|nr:hypothetical protein [Candidatus Saccharibacteria bacterium]
MPYQVKTRHDDPRQYFYLVEDSGGSGLATTKFLMMLQAEAVPLDQAVALAEQDGTSSPEDVFQGFDSVEDLRAYLLQLAAKSFSEAAAAELVKHLLTLLSEQLPEGHIEREMIALYTT